MRRAFSLALDARWQKLRAAMTEAVAARFANRAHAITHAAMTGQEPVTAFRDWFDEAARQIVVGADDGLWTSRYLKQGAGIGRERADNLTENTNAARDRTPGLVALAASELQGICDAVGQQAARAFANAELVSASASRTTQDVGAVIKAVGMKRSQALAEFMVVRAHALATLDSFRAAGVTTVGTAAERARTRPSSQLLARDAKKKKRKFIAEEVEVLTAGDDEVCDICQEISDGGPYDIDDADMLIPAHPRCRCAFVPAEDRRFASVHDSRTTRAAGVLMIDPEGRVLFLKRSDSSDHPGEWCLPAGAVDGDETAEEAMVREVYEEVGYDDPMEDVVQLDHKISDEGVEFTTFAASVPTFTPKLNDEHTDACWCMPDNAPLPLHPGLLSTLQRLQLHDYDPSEERDDHGMWSTGVGDHPMPEKSVMMHVEQDPTAAAAGPGFVDGSVEVLINPSERTVLGYAKDIAKDTFDYSGKKGSLATLRVMTDVHGNVLAWNGLRAIHTQVLKAAQSMGMQFPADLRSVLYKHEGQSWDVTNGRLSNMAVMDIMKGQKVARSAAGPVAAPSIVPRRYAEPARPVFGKKKVVARDDFNPDEPRNEKGEWTTGGASQAIEMKNLTKVSGKMGSNEGGVYEDETTGHQYYVKEPKTKDHVTNELIAAKLYQLAGVPTLDYVPVKGGSGKYVATVLQPLYKNNVSQLSPVERKTAQSDFAVHAWLANWDAVGTGGDNVGVVGGKVTVLDTGGSLEYRAQGEPKGDMFGETVHEVESLRDPSKSPDAAALYGSMSKPEIIASIDRVKAISDGDIVKTVVNMGGKMGLANKLIARKDDLASYANILKGKPQPNLAPIAKATEPELDLTPAAVPVTPVFKTKMDHAKHLLMKGTTSDELKKALGWPSIGVPKVASDLKLKLEKTKGAGGAFFYKGTPMTPAEIAAKGGKAAPAAATPVASEPKKVDVKSLPVIHTKADFQSELLSKKSTFATISQHKGKSDHWQISGSVDKAKEIAEVAKSHPEWTLKPGMSATYEAPKNAFLSVEEPKQHDITTPVGNFKQALEHNNVEYTSSESGTMHTIVIKSGHEMNAGEVAHWHPLVTPGDEEGKVYYVKKAGAAAPAASKIELAPIAVVPAFDPGIATAAELEKAKKSNKLTLQYVPGAPQDHPEAQKLVDLFNAKYEGETLTDPVDLKNKVDAFKKLQHEMVPLMNEQQKQQAIAAVAEQNAAKAKKEAAAKAEADKVANLHNLPEEEQREYWLNKIGAGPYLNLGKEEVKYSKALQATGITGAEVGFIQAFTGPHSQVNEAMRDGHMSEETFAFKHIMNEALAKMPPYTGEAVYRKIQLDSIQQAKYVPGQIAHWKAFNSTSKNEDTWSGNTHFTIRNPKTGVDVQSISSNPSEAEVIMPADSYYKVLSNKKMGSNTHIELEEVLPFGKKKKVA